MIKNINIVKNVNMINFVNMQKNLNSPRQIHITRNPKRIHIDICTSQNTRK